MFFYNFDIYKFNRGYYGMGEIFRNIKEHYQKDQDDFFKWKRYKEEKGIKEKVLKRKTNKRTKMPKRNSWKGSR